MCDDFGFSDDPFKAFDGNGKRDGFSVASNATSTTRSTCSSEESSRLKGSGKDKGTSSRRLRAAGPPRTTSSREGPSRTGSSREGASRTSSSREGTSSTKSSPAVDFGSSFGNNAFDNAAFSEFSEPFGTQTRPAASAPAPAAAPAAVPSKQRARRRASVAGGTPAPAPAAVAQPDPAVEPQRRPLPERQRSRSGERSIASSDSRRPGGRRTTRRSSNGDTNVDSGIPRAKSADAFMGFDDNSADGTDMFGYGDGSPTGAADYGYGDDAQAADFGYEDHKPASEDDGYGDDDDAPPQPKKELPRAKLSRARRSSIGVTQFGGSSDAFLNDLCGRSARDLMGEKDMDKPKPKPATGPSIAMPLAEGPTKAGGGARRGGGRRASLIGGMNVGVGVLTKQAEKLDDPDSARKNKASFFKDRSGDKTKGPTSRNKSASDGIQSYNPDRDRRQMMKD